MSAPRDWRHGATTQLQHCRVFSVASSLATSPITGDDHVFYRIDSPDWVNVVPVTPTGEVVMVRQFRHGSREVTLEIPGGLVDPGESPVEAAARELLEETGYRGADALPFGRVNPNPALFGNVCHTFLIRDVERVAAIENGPTEETVVEVVEPGALRRLLDEGHVDHALVQVALYRYLLASQR